MSRSSKFCSEVKRSKIKNLESSNQFGSAKIQEIVVGLGADDVPENCRGEGTKYLAEKVLWNLRMDDFEKQSWSGQKFPCPKCSRFLRYYCERCLELVGDRSLVPLVDLPIEVLVLQHESESRSKSTAVYGQLVSPQVSIRMFPDELPVDLRAEDTVVLFPSQGATSVRDLDWGRVRRVVLVDTTWITTHKVMRHPVVAALPCVALTEEQTTFWRYHAYGAGCLSTLECIFHLLRQRSCALTGFYSGEFDGIMFFYAHFYRLIQMQYLKKVGQSFLHKNNYIHYEKAAAEAAALSRLGLRIQDCRAEGDTSTEEISEDGRERLVPREGQQGNPPVNLLSDGIKPGEGVGDAGFEDSLQRAKGATPGPGGATDVGAVKLLADAARARFFAASEGPSSCLNFDLFEPELCASRRQRQQSSAEDYSAACSAGRKATQNFARAVVSFRVPFTAKGQVHAVQVRYRGTAQKQHAPLHRRARAGHLGECQMRIEEAWIELAADDPVRADASLAAISDSGAAETAPRSAGAEDSSAELGALVRRMWCEDLAEGKKDGNVEGSVTGSGCGEGVGCAGMVEVRIKVGGSGWSAWSPPAVVDACRLRSCWVRAQKLEF